jgi:mono/diheme cytochrome c family protein
VTARDVMIKPVAFTSILSLTLGLLLLYKFGTDQFPTAQAAADIELGKRIYLQNCAACHGQKGDGKGPEADRLETRPRDFTDGKYKFRSTPSGSFPLDEDIVRTISRGVRTTSMLAQLHLTEGERRAVTEYLKTFSKRFQSETPRDPISIPARPSSSLDLVTLGKRTYTEAGCNRCHGSEGKGDGASAKELKDDWGEPISPTDLTLKPFKSGAGPEDLFRAISTGFNGTPMPSYGESLTVRERWAVVSYILSIATRNRPRGMMGLVGEEGQGMRIDMRAAMAGMMGSRGMMRGGGGMMDRNMRDMMKSQDGEIAVMEKKFPLLFLLAAIWLWAPLDALAQQGKRPAFEHVHALAMDSGGQTLFFGAHTGLFRSDDRGRTWNKASVSTRHAHLDVMDIAADPKDPKTIYIATHEARVCKSTDGGKTWKEASSGLGGPDAHGLAIDPSMPVKLRAVREKGEGIYRTTAQGGKWIRVDDGPQGEIKVLKSVNIPTGMGGIFLYAGTSTGLQRSPDCF